MELTFEQLPKAFTDLQKTVNDIKTLLLEKSKESQSPPDELLTVEQAATFLKLSKPTIYGLISKGEIPVMKRSKRCYFSKVELTNYIKQGRKQTNDEIKIEAENFINRKAK